MIKKIAIIGAGAIGAYFLDCFQGHDELEVVVIAEGERKEKLQTQGIIVNGKRLELNVKSASDCGTTDLVLVATKYNGLEDVKVILPLLVHENSIVLSLLNGVDSEQQLAKVIGEERIVYSLMRISSQRVGQSITYKLGETAGLFYGSDKQEQLDALDELFKTTTVYYHVVEDIKKDIWFKYASNIANNLPQAILQIPSVLYTNEHGYFIASKLWEEVRKVALSQGIELQEKPLIFSGALTSKFSTLQDIEAKRHTEVDMFVGVLIELAHQNGIEVPYSEYTYHLIKALECKNDGLFEVE